MSDKKTLMNEIDAVVKEVQDLLKKSMPEMDGLDKADPELAPPSEDPEAEAGVGAEGAPAPDAIAEQGAPEDGAAEGGLEGEAEMSDQDLAGEAQQLSDEELDKLLEVLMAEKQGRGAQAQEGAPAPEAAPPAPAMEDPAQKAMKEDYSKLGKSLDAITGSIAALSKRMDAFTAKPAQKPTAKAPAANASEVQVLHKSTPVAKRLSKSETVSFLENQLKKGNKLVDRNVMLDVVSAKSDGELHGVQDALTKAGIEFPKL